MKRLDGLCIAVTAKGKDFDYVSRVFAPELDVIEDPVTGSTHCMIAPYWIGRLGKNEIAAFQASKRTGVLYCKAAGESSYFRQSGIIFRCRYIAAMLSEYC